ncbi:MAG TPA: carboxypeptidase regulatory-like domain-containing protein, partial [Gemmatimonadales bacterium]|nr:carboxypeptidase regulatory-like domain-containing protein [Gemmatimonadales bacterium]
ADLAHPYVSAMGSLTWAWTVQAEAVANALVRAGVAYEPTLNLRLGADFTRFDDDVEASLANPLDRRSQLRLAAFVRPDTRHDHIYVDATAEFATRENATSSRLHGALSAQVGGLRLQPYARHEREAVSGAAAVSRTYGGVTLFLIPSGRVGPLLRNSWIRASAEAENFATPRLASFSVARPIARSLRIEAGVNWVRGSGGPAFTLTLASAFDAVRTFTTVSAQSRTPAAVTQYVQGSVLYDRSTGITFDAGPSLQRSGVAGMVYLDVNGNGARDAGEEGLSNVRVQVGTGSALSDSTGAYRVWDIVPFEPVVVVPDSMSFESPLWVTTGDATAVLPAPNRFTVVDIPLSVGAVLEGRVTRAFGGAMQGVAGATLELTELRSGTQRRVTTFSDGAFYILGIPPGDYELRVGPRILEILRVTAAPWRFAIGPDGAGPASIEISLEPATD